MPMESRDLSVGIFLLREYKVNNGFVKLWRKFTETSFFTKPLTSHLAIYLLLEANHEPYKTMIGKDEITLNRGQLITGIYKIKHNTGISIRSARTAIAHLEHCGFITRKTTSKASIITICNYNDYQSRATNSSTSDRQATDKQPTTIQEGKEGKEGKEEKKRNKHSFEDSPFYDFESFKKALPNWDDSKCREYHKKARRYSGANGGKYLNWILAVQNWADKDTPKRDNGEEFLKLMKERASI